jgi:hypothetical protein
MERLRETEGSTLNIGLPGGAAGRLPSLGEVSEPDSSSNGSRSSSRSSRRSRSSNSRGGPHGRSRPRERAPGDALGEPNHHTNGLRSQSSSSSLRLGPDGEPLEDGPDLTDPHVSRKRFLRVFPYIQFTKNHIASFGRARMARIPTVEGQWNFTAEAPSITKSAPSYIRWYITINHSCLLRR